MNPPRSTRAIFAALLMLGAGGALFAAPEETSRPPKNLGELAPKVDLNTADSRTLETLPGVTPMVAKAIVAARPFRSVDDLQKVEGIATENFELLKRAVTVSVTPKYVAKILPPAETAQRAASRAGVDLNTASRERLEALAGATPEAVQAILAARPFSSVDDLDRVKGLTAEQLEQLRAAVRVSPVGSGTAPPSR
ncbi:MAG TPA: helix-hairpin-helix domain-containing protein [Opitutaceae bacterium]|nr:helix-hairpin-helix domain-containing protein [Opitutaceae bacterium]